MERVLLIMDSLLEFFRSVALVLFIYFQLYLLLAFAPALFYEIRESLRSSDLFWYYTEPWPSSSDSLSAGTTFDALV